MPGGPQRKEARDYEPLVFPQPGLELSREEWELDLAMHRCRQARQFAKAAQRIAVARGLSFIDWQVLEVTNRWVREKGDAVSQREVARRAELAKSTVCETMQRSRRAGLVDIAPDQWGISDRILVTDRGTSLLAKLRGELVELTRRITW